jgi:hypothetical protein
MLPVIQQQTHPLISGSEKYYLNLVDHVIFAPVSNVIRKTTNEIPHFALILTVARQLHFKTEIKVSELTGLFGCVYVKVFKSYWSVPNWSCKHDDAAF